MTNMTRVARFEGDGVVRIEERPLPPLADGLVRLAVTRCGLCGSDKRLLRSGASQVPGHEIVGVVTAVGGGISDLAVGARCAVYIPLFCGRCDNCTAGWTNRCSELAQLVGWQYDGGFAEHVDVPSRNLIPIPDDLSDDLAVLVLDTVGTAAHALRQAQALHPGGRVLVVGCGPLGLGTIIVASALGFDHVAAIDPAPARFAAARALGASVADDAPYDVIVEASGASAARQRIMELVNPGCAVLMLGESDEPWLLPATPSWRRNDAFYIRTFYFPLRDVLENFAILRSCKDQLATLIDVRAPLDDLQAVFEDFTAGKTLKPLICMTTGASVHG